MRKSPRFRIVSTDTNRCEVHYRHPEDGQSEVDHYWAPDGGGYVRVEHHGPCAGTLSPQAMDEELANGSTLHWGGKTPFVNLIRRQVKAYWRHVDRANKEW